MSYLYYKVKRFTRSSINQCLKRGYPIPSKLAGKRVLDIEDSAESIFSLISSPKSCMIARIGTTEMGVINNYFDIKYLGSKAYTELKKNTLINNAGYFGDVSDDGYKKFSELYLDAFTRVDGLGILTGSEEYVIHKYMQNAQLYTLRGLEPYYSVNPWTQALEGRKVLVVHPFAESIEKQYQRRELLFTDSRILPRFDLKTMKAIQTIAGVKDPRFNTWFEALDYMTEEALKIDFDIAIIGCGAYGLPLATRIKDAGKKAVHLGGATQVLFGIKGKRWDSHPVISNLYNGYWVRPEGNEIVKDNNKVENGCYW